MPNFGHYDERIQRNFEFHTLTAQATCNRFSMIIVSGLTDALRSLIDKVGSDLVPNLFSMRRDLIKALAARDEEAAARSMARIVKTTEQTYKRLAEERAAPGGVVRGRWVARRNDAFNICWCQDSGQRTEAPMGQLGDGAQQSSRASTGGDQEAKEHAQPSRTVIRRSPPYLLTPFHNELAQEARGQLAGIFANETDQFSYRSAVVGQRAIGRATLVSHPLTERPQQLRLRSDCLGEADRGAFRAMQIREEQACPVDDVYASRTVKPTAAASAKMPIESRESRAIQTADR